MAKVALLIGVSEYEPGLTALPAAVKDIEAMQRVLKDPEMGGFDTVKTLANPDPQTMQYEIETLFSEAAKDDLVLLFFSGHGIKDDAGRLYFSTRITRKNEKGDLIRSSAVPGNFVHDIMNNSRARRQAIILDCCFSGAFDPALQTKDDGSVDLQTQLGAEGRVVLASSSTTQYSFEQQGSDLSLYTRYLVEGMQSGAADRDEDGKITIFELHEYATTKVQETAPIMKPKLITLKDMGFEIVLAKAKITDPKLRYRRQVERYANQGSISSIGRNILGKLQTQLSLSSEIVQEIESEVLKPYQEYLENLQKYQEELLDVIKREYPFSNQTKCELKDLQEILGLEEKDVNPIEQKIIKKSFKELNINQEKHKNIIQENNPREYLKSRESHQENLINEASINRLLFTTQSALATALRLMKKLPLILLAIIGSQKTLAFIFVFIGVISIVIGFSTDVDKTDAPWGLISIIGGLQFFALGSLLLWDKAQFRSTTRLVWLFGEILVISFTVIPYEHDSTPILYSVLEHKSLVYPLIFSVLSIIWVLILSLSKSEKLRTFWIVGEVLVAVFSARINALIEKINSDSGFFALHDYSLMILLNKISFFSIMSITWIFVIITFQNHYRSKKV